MPQQHPQRSAESRGGIELLPVDTEVNALRAAHPDREGGCLPLSSTALVRPGVWCEAVTAAENEPGAEGRRGAYAAASPEAAIRWLRVGARAVASSLGPLQAGYVLDHWVHGPGSLQDYVRLRRGRPCALTVYRNGHRLTWRAHPVRFVRLAAVSGRRPCTDRCRARTAAAPAGEVQWP